MPSNLDLTLSNAHGNMLLSPRNGPGMTLRRAASYTNLEKGPQSSTSSRFSFNHLVHTPPPSPGLPALIPRHGKPAPSVTPRRLFRLFLWLVGVSTVLYFAFKQIQANNPLPNVGWSNHDDQQYEMIGEDVLPDFPTSLVVMDKRGRAKWTISIPSNLDFPLEPEVYSEICSTTKQASDQVAEMHAHKKKTHQAHYDYYHIDQYYMDVAEAVDNGMLPKPGMATLHGGFSQPGDEGHMIGESGSDLVQGKVCEKSLTFVLETGDAGLGSTLMMLWTAYGLAVKEGRAFFVDDSRWAYGKYSTFFRPPPIPACRPPPRHEIVPCPHHARHLLVSAATVQWTFGGAFNEAFENPRKMEVFRQEPLFNLARTGYEALFNLSSPDSAYVETRLAEFQKKTTLPNGSKGLSIGIHVRHGDRHPLEFQYRSAYLPNERYADTARDILYTTFNDTAADGGEDLMAEMHSVMILASDDPDVYNSVEFSHSPRAQDLIRLAADKTEEATSASEAKPATVTTMRNLRLAAEVAGGLRLDEINMFKRFEEETVGWGWEGGFFAGMFWSLGRASGIPASGASSQPDSVTKIQPSKEALRLRELVGRAYLMDLAVLSQSDKVVCAVSAMGCKLLAVMMGWEKAVVQGNWKNVDGEFQWRGVAWK